MGKWSRACTDCKGRKVKCDGTRPACTNCLRRGVVCPGWTEEDGVVVFQAQTRQRPFDGERKKRTRTVSKTNFTYQGTSESSDSTYLSITESTFPETTSPEVSSPDTQLQWSISDSPYDAAIAVIIQNCPGIDDSRRRSLMQLWGNMAPGTSGLHHIVYASAFTFMPKTAQLQRMSVVHYGRALRAVNKALQHPTMCTSDEVLLTILHISFYEFSTNPGKNVRKHLTGLQALVERRGLDNFEDTPISRLILNEIHMLETSIFDDLTSTLPRLNVISCEADCPPMCSLTALGDRIPSLFEEVAQLPRRTSDSERLDQLLVELETLDRDLLDLWKNRPSSWYFEGDCIGPAFEPTITRDIARGFFFYNDNTFKLAVTLTTWRIYRIHVLTTLLRLHQYRGYQHDDASVRITAELRGLADGIIDTASAFFATEPQYEIQYPNNHLLFQVGCWCFVRPLAIALSVEVADVTKRRWVLDKISLLAQQRFEGASALVKHYRPMLNTLTSPRAPTVVLREPLRV